MQKSVEGNEVFAELSVSVIWGLASVKGVCEWVCSVVTDKFISTAFIARGVGEPCSVHVVLITLLLFTPLPLFGSPQWGTAD